MKNPCKNCEKRELKCHSSCEEYKLYRAELDSINEKRRAYNEKVSFEVYEKERMRKRYGN